MPSFSVFLFFKSSKGFSLTAIRGWKRRCICAIAPLSVFPFMSQTKTLFWSSSRGIHALLRASVRRYYLACNSSRAFVCQTNVSCVFAAALCTRDGEPTCPGRVSAANGLTSRLMERAGIFSRSPVAVNVVKLALDQVTANHCRLASTVSKSPTRSCLAGTCKWTCFLEEKKK